MTTLLEWLLDLQRISIAEDAPLSLQWHRAAPAWMLFGFGLVALSIIGWAYRRESGSTHRRVALGVMRCALVALVVAMLCQPALVLQRNRVEHSQVTLLVDSSQSMATLDRYGDTVLAGSVARGADLADTDGLSDRSRLNLVTTALLSRNAEPLRRLLQQNAVQVVHFAGTTEVVGYAGVGESPEAIAASLRSIQTMGRQTDLASAITTVVEESQGRRLAAVVIATDGQSTQSTSLKDALGLAAGRRIPIYPLRIGSPEPLRDVRVGPLRAPERVFMDDILPIEAELRVTGLRQATTITVRLIEDRTNTVIATAIVEIDPTNESKTVELRTKTRRLGEVRYRVEAQPLENETHLDNNSDTIDVSVLDNRIRVLYVDAYPRFEYRYLKNALLRERTVELSVLLLEADERFVQEGTAPIRRFPETPEELNRYDVVLMGDVDPRAGWMSESQMRYLRDFVAESGGGFGVIAGERSAPHRFVSTPLEPLLCVRVSAEVSGRSTRVSAGGFRPRLTTDGLRSRLFRFSEDRALSERIFNALPPLYWIAETKGPAPGATTLLEHPTLRSFHGAMPVAVVGRYGAGRLFFQATDETWRWRRHTGEWLHDSYWVQVVRMLMPGHRSRAERQVFLRTDRRVYEYGDPVRAVVEVEDAQLLSSLGDSIEIVVRSQADVGDAVLVLQSDASGAVDGTRSNDRTKQGQWVVARFGATRIGPDSGVYEGMFHPPRPGSYRLEVPDVLTDASVKSASALVLVNRPDLESRRPEANHEVLERIAEVTNGQVIALDALDEGFAAIRSRSVQIPDDITESLWDSKLAFGLFVFLVSAEWGLRKMFGLL